MKIKKGKLNYDQSGRAYPPNPRVKENWDCIWEYEGKYYKLVGDNEHKEWDEVNIYNQIIDEVYNKYLTRYMGYEDVPSKELFLFEIKNNPEFSEKWGLTIEERELSLEERHQLALPIWKEKYGPLADMMVSTNVDNTPFKIPTKLITLEYNQEKIYYYE
jgi:hypothetical protein